MGYFPNGDAGIWYFEKYCSKCEHDRNEDCPIWAAHLFYNYDECNNDKSILHMLIPRTEDGLGNEECKLFIPLINGPITQISCQTCKDDKICKMCRGDHEKCSWCFDGSCPDCGEKA